MKSRKFALPSYVGLFCPNTIYTKVDKHLGMKYLFSNILLISTLFCSGQNMSEGLFFNRKKDIGFESDIFEFKENKKFNYIFFTCTGTGIGTGNYEIQNDTLYLNFIDNPDYKIKNEIQFKKETSDSLSINLKVIDYADSILIPGAGCYFLEEKIGWQTNLDGEILAKAKRVKHKRKLRIDYIGCEPIEIEISPEVTEITGTVRLTNFWFYNSTDQLKFKIISNFNNRFKLDRYKNLNITYRRIHEKKVFEMVKYNTRKTYGHFFKK